MDKNEFEKLSESKGAESKELTASKRRILMPVQFYFNGRRNKLIGWVNSMLYFYSHFETTFELNRGDVLLFNFQFEIGNELKDPHYCVVLLHSSKQNQLVTIVPLHSAKENRELNPASEVYLGQIPGLTNGKNAIALINQTRTVDKRRLFSQEAVENFNLYVGGSKYIESYKEFVLGMKHVYRLTDEQFSKVRRAVEDYFFNGYIKHEY